ncbi:MAG: pilus assembly protein PilX [Acinetobacter sp.]
MWFARKQHGMTLLVVLMIVFVMTLMGAIAIRQGAFALDIAGQGQVNPLMLHNADTAILQLEHMPQLAQQWSVDGVFNAIRPADNHTKELVLCYRGHQAEPLNIAHASLMQWSSGEAAPNGTAWGTQGYCSSQSGRRDFSSGRHAVMTQISIRLLPVTEADQPFSGDVAGTDFTMAQLTLPENMEVHAVSLMPALSTAMGQQIDDCLSTKMTVPIVPLEMQASSEAKQSVTECLAAFNIPFVVTSSVLRLRQTIAEI